MEDCVTNEAIKLLEDCRSALSEVMIIQKTIDNLIQSNAPSPVSISKIYTGEVRSGGQTKSASTFLPLFNEWVLKLKSEIERLIDTQKKCEQVIERIRNPKFRKLLRLRYFLNESWELIAEEMDVSIFYVHKLKKKALKAFSNEFGKMT